MTCVIAMRESETNVVHIAADRAISVGGIGNVSGAKLVRFASGLLVGFAGSLATQNVLVTRPELCECDLANEKSIAALFDKFHAVAGFQLPTLPPNNFWGLMLLAMKGDLVFMGNAAGWYRVADPVKAIGDGDRVALGSWYERHDLGPKERLERAIEVSALRMPGVVSKESDYQHT